MPDARRCGYGAGRWRAMVVAGAMLAVVSGCAKAPVTTTLAPALPPAHPEFQYPSVPTALRNSPAVALLDRGWQDLQRDRAPEARREFAAALQRDPGFYPALTGQGYTALTEQQYEQALVDFDRALSQAADYMPALVGRGHALLALDRVDAALLAFDEVARRDPSIEGIRERVDVLKFRSLQARIAEARAAAAAGRTTEARQAYEAALATSPDSGFLYQELAAVESRAGDGQAAVRHLRQAVAIDPADVAALMDLGGVLERLPDLSAALEVYAQVEKLQPSPELSDRVAAVTRRVRDERLPAELRALPALPQVTRGDLAALIGVRLEALVTAAPSRPNVVTDTRGHWAAAWITRVVDAGIMNPLDNHTFQPGAGLRRVDLAEVAARLVGFITPPAGAPARRPAIADVPPSHLSFGAIAVVVNAGVMPLLDGQQFQVSRVVTGAEAVDVIDRIGVLAAGR